MPTPATTPSASPVGSPISRVDGRLKVTGRAVYAGDTQQPDAVHAVLVTSPIAKGKIASIDTTAAEAAVGVIQVVTPLNMPKLNPPKKGNPMTGGGLIEELRMPLSDLTIDYAGQHIAVVVAETLDQARHAAALLTFRFDAQTPRLSYQAGFGDIATPNMNNGQPLQVQRGDIGRVVAGAAANGLTVVNPVYDTPTETHNPMEPSATVAAWNGPDKVTIWDATQFVKGVQATISSIFELKPDNVRVLSPFLGGAFGCKGSQWPHTILAVALAKWVGRPVRLVLTRQQMFTCTGHRPPTNQAMTLAAKPDGTLLALGHASTIMGSVVGDFIEPCGAGTSRVMYAAPNLSMTHALNKVNVSPPTFMRAPGEAPGMFALESAMDELAVELKIDPIALRLTNHADVNPHDDKPWSGKHLKACYTLGAEKFGWSKYRQSPGTMRAPDGRRMGWGVAGATYPANRFPGTARIRLMNDAGGLRVIAAAATHDLGTGAYTVFTQIAAAQVGLPIERVKFELGDSGLPYGPVAGGSTSTASVGQALVDAGNELRAALLKSSEESGSKILAGLTKEQVILRNGRLYAADDETKSEDVARLVARTGRAYIEGHAGAPADVGTSGQATGQNYGKAEGKFALHSWGVHFVEVIIDTPAPRVIVNRVVSVMDVGRVINPKTATSQIIGGVVMGIGMALMEETHYDPVTGKPATDNLADYAVCVNADVPPIEVHFVGEPDLNFNALGCRGVGEIGITGITAAIANAVYNATGRRVRDLPITPDKLL